MADDNTIKAINQLGLGVRTPEAKDRKALGQEEFFELMVAQLNNQDPLKPLDSAEFMSQTAEFSMVDGIKSIEQSISQLATSMESNQALQASTLVGRDVLVPGDRLVHEPGTSSTGAIDLPGSATNVTLEIATPAGEIVRTMELGAHPAGSVPFSWEGLRDDETGATAGQYVVTARGEMDGQTFSMPVLVGARVDSVTINRNPPGTTLNLQGIGPVNMNQVREFI